uniref:Prominin 1 b n=1 Tax=Sander lucioperca TaxID=283035 RepID=A0A8C9ZDB0_SANLU
MLWTRWLVLLLCWGATSGEQQADESDGAPPRQRSPPPVEPLDFGFVPAAVYDTHAYYEPGPIGILFHMVHAFLYAIQPNPFPKEMIVKVIQQNMGGIKIEEWRKVRNDDCMIPLLLQWIYYEVGFLTCATIGITFVVLIPIIGMCFCVCRCCENCGGEMHQRQRKNADCQRGFYTASLVATSIFIILGVLIAYAANHNVTTQIKSTRRLINTNMRDLKTFANNTPAVCPHTHTHMPYIGPLLGGRIHSQLEKEVVPSLDTALRMAGAMRETKEALENVSSSLEVLQEGTAKLQASLSGERASLSNTLSDPACTNGAVSHTCNTIRSTLAQLGINADFSELPDVSHALANVNTVLKTDLSNIVQKGYSSFNDTPKLVHEQTKNIVSGVKGMLDKIGTEINSFSKMFPVQESLVNFTNFLNQGQKNIESYYSQVDQLDFYRWIGCVAALCMVVLVLAFNTLGLLCGACGYDKQATPTTRGCLSNTGGNLLMAGVGFSFIFAWVLMAIVTTLFVVGGNVEKLICEPLANRQLFKIIDTPFLVHPAKKNFLPGMLFQNPNIDLTLGSLYSKMNGNLYSLYVCVLQQYNKDLAKVFESVQVDLQDIMLLEQAGRDNLINFANSGVGEIDYEAYLAEVCVCVCPRGALENALKGHASSIRQIHREQVVPMLQAMLTAEVAQCKPISNIVDSMEIVACSFIVDSVNTFWFGLGGCCILLIPSIIFSVKLAKYYRRMDTEDVFEDSPYYDTLTRFPRASAPPSYSDW